MKRTSAKGSSRDRGRSIFVVKWRDASGAAHTTNVEARHRWQARALMHSDSRCISVESVRRQGETTADANRRYREMFDA